MLSRPLSRNFCYNVDPHTHEPAIPTRLCPCPHNLIAVEPADATDDPDPNHSCPVTSRVSATATQELKCSVIVHFDVGPTHLCSFILFQPDARTSPSPTFTQSMPLVTLHRSGKGSSGSSVGIATRLQDRETSV
jgi:hypothetical protein